MKYLVILLIPLMVGCGGNVPSLQELNQALNDFDDLYEDYLALRELTDEYGTDISGLRSDLEDARYVAATATQEIEDRSLESLRTIYFDFDVSTLDSRALQSCEYDLNILRDFLFPEYTVEIEGHCDSRGDEAYNDLLGRDRSQAVYEWLEMNGMKMDNFCVVSVGERAPLALEHDLNRCVIIKVIR